MADIVTSAIVGEAVSLVFSGIANTTRKDKDKSDQEAAEDGMERLEMARIKMEAALEKSSKWQITDVSLLHWRKKLKRAARDCDDAARRCRELSHEEDEREQLVSQSSFPSRIAHATKTFVSSFVGGKNNNDHGSAGTSVAATIRRFERFADGAGEFMRFVQLGGTPRRPHLFFNPLIGHIFAGESLLYQVSHRRGQYSFGMWPVEFEERGLEAILACMHEDLKVPKNSFHLVFMMRLSESTDIIGTIVKCLRLMTPHFNSTADVAIKEITQLPTQDFLCVPREVANTQMEKLHPGLWNHAHRFLTTWFRPDPLCCQGYEHQGNISSCGGGSSIDNRNKLRISSIFPEPVCVVFLQRYISLSEYIDLVPVSSTATAAGYDHTSASLENSTLVKLRILILPHDSLEEDPKFAGEAGYAIEAINGAKQPHFTHSNVHLNQLDEMLLPKAIDYLYHNAEATTYQICWRSNHGSAHLCMEKTPMIGARRSTQLRNNNKVLHQMEQDRQIKWKQVAKDFLKLWVVRSSEMLHSLVSTWLNEDKASG